MEKVSMEDIINYLKSIAPSNDEFFIYCKEEKASDLRLPTLVFKGEFPEYDDSDNEIYPDFVNNNNLLPLCSSRIIEDCIINANSQKQTPSNSEILKSFAHYMEKDSFLQL